MSTEMVLVRHLALRAARSATPWGVAFGLVVYSSAVSYLSAYPHPAERSAIATSLGSNTGITALFGPARSLTSVGGFTAWRSLGVLMIVGGIWGLLSGAKLLRGEEDSGRWEMLLSGSLTRRSAAACGVAASWLALLWLWVLTLLGALLAASTTDFPVRSSPFLATALVAPAAVFVSIGLLCGQLAGSRRSAALLGAAVFGAAFLLRFIAIATGRAWLHGLTPLGWIDALHPMTGSRFAPLIPVLTVCLLAAAGTVASAGARDLGAAPLALGGRRRHGTWMLGGPWGLSIRQTLPGVLGWAAGIAVVCAILGLVSGSVADAATKSDSLHGLVSRLGSGGSGTRAFVGLTMISVTSAIALAAASYVAGIRESESAGLADVVLGQPVSRRRWLVGRLVVASGGVLLLGIVTGTALWLAVSAGPGGVGVGALFAAGLNTVPVALVVIGVGVLVFGVAPRGTAIVAYGLVAWSFLDELVGAVVDAPRWVLDLSVLHHVRLAPAVDPDWRTNAVLVVIAAVAAAVGAVTFERRDLTRA